MPKTAAHVPVTGTPEALWTAEDVAAHVGVSVRTVYGWNYKGEGPPRIRVGKYVRYRRVDVDAWLAARVVDLS